MSEIFLCCAPCAPCRPEGQLSGCACIQITLCAPCILPAHSKGVEKAAFDTIDRLKHDPKWLCYLFPILNCFMIGREYHIIQDPDDHHDGLCTCGSGECIDTWCGCCFCPCAFYSNFNRFAQLIQEGSIKREEISGLWGMPWCCDPVPPPRFDVYSSNSDPHTRVKRVKSLGLKPIYAEDYKTVV